MSKDPEYTIGLDIGGTNLRAAVVDGEGTIHASDQIPTPSSVDALESSIVSLVQGLGRDYPISAVGLAVAGFISADQTTVRFAPHLPWRNAEVVDRLSAELELPVLLEHDANAATWGEYRYGALRGSRNAVLWAIGTGIGGGVLINGALFGGAFGTAPEFGHLTVVPNGRACPCGKRGCLERYSSGSALVLTAKELIATHRTEDSELIRQYGKRPEALTGRSIIELARRGDELALEVVENFSYWLGKGLSMVQDTFDPETIVIAGGVAMDSDLFLQDAEEEFHESVVGAGYREVALVQTAQLGSSAGMIGVADLAREQFLK